MILNRWAQDLNPEYFALVMATGIVSISAHLLNMNEAAWGLFIFNLAAYLILIVLTGVRAVRFFPRLKADLLHPRTGFNFLTAVSGTCLLGTDLPGLVVTFISQMTPSVELCLRINYL